MSLYVLKFGGSSVANIERMKHVADIIATFIHRGEHVGAKTVVSKKRYINPYLNGKGRMVNLSDAFAQALEPFLAQRLDEPLWGE